MTSHFRLAHLSDPHLGPLPPLTIDQWSLKRATGFLNWHSKRQHRHSMAVLQALVGDVAAADVDHVAVGGDLANLGLPEELSRAVRWLGELGTPDRVSVVPGNHDVYVPFGRDAGIARWMAHMTEDAPARAAPPAPPGGFPYVRRRGPLALIGLCSAVPTPPFVAAGKLGADQLLRLAEVLRSTHREGLVRVVSIHHPPLPGQADGRRGLRDAAGLTDVLDRHGAELVLHGHLHTATLVWRTSGVGPVPALGVPSASMALRHRHEPLARWHLLDFAKLDGQPVIDLVVRGLAAPDGRFVELGRSRLTPGCSYPTLATQ